MSHPQVEQARNVSVDGYALTSMYRRGRLGGFALTRFRCVLISKTKSWRTITRTNVVSMLSLKESEQAGLARNTFEPLGVCSLSQWEVIVSDLACGLRSSSRETHDTATARLEMETTRETKPGTPGGASVPVLALVVDLISTPRHWTCQTGTLRLNAMACAMQGAALATFPMRALLLQSNQTCGSYRLLKVQLATAR